MSSTLILYATTEGHTARIAERIAQHLRGKGHRVKCPVLLPFQKVWSRRAMTG